MYWIAAVVVSIYLLSAVDAAAPEDRGWVALAFVGAALLAGLLYVLLAWSRTPPHLVIEKTRLTIVRSSGVREVVHWCDVRDILAAPMRSLIEITREDHSRALIWRNELPLDLELGELTSLLQSRWEQSHETVEAT